jgi:PAS domain S-box-containing protein
MDRCDSAVSAVALLSSDQVDAPSNELRFRKQGPLEWNNAGLLSEELWIIRDSLLIQAVMASVIVLLFAFLLTERRARLRSQTSLSERLALEHKIAEFSRRLALDTPEEIDAEIQEGLEQFRKLLEADRMYWYQNRLSSSTFERVYYTCGPQVEPPPVSVSGEQPKFVMRLLLKGLPVRLGTLEDLPVAAEEDKKFFARLKIKSLVLIPSNPGRTTRGLLGLASVTSERNWHSDLISQLAVLGDIIASAVQRKEAQLASRYSETRFRLLFEEMPIGIALEDRAGRIINVNPAFCSIMGFAEQELLQLSCRDFSHPEDLVREAHLFEELQSGNRKSYQMEKRFFRKDRSIFWGHISVCLLTNADGGSPLIIAALQDISEMKTAEEKLRAATLELQHLTARIIQAQDEERKRISQDLHDDISQRIALLSVGLETLSQEFTALGVEPGRHQVADLRRLADELGTDIHNLSHELHSSKLQHFGLAAALKELCNRVSAQNQLVVTFAATRNLGKQLPPDVALCLFRVTQEALANVFKHSQAKEASVEVVQTQETIHLKVTDQGRGFDPSARTSGIGLTSMRERLHAVGGELVVRSALGAGTQIIAEVKMAKTAVAGTLRT